MYFKKIDNLPTRDVFPELEHMTETGVLTWDYMNQICVNSPAGQDSPYAGVGSLDIDYTQSRETEYGMEFEKRQVPIREADFTELCSVFQDTGIGELYQALTKNYSVGRVRLMRSKPRYAMSWHYDYNDRLHYPIKTQFGCFMVIEQEVQHLEQNQWYWTATRENYHTAFNGSNEYRVHLVACLL